MFHKNQEESTLELQMKREGGRFLEKKVNPLKFEIWKMPFLPIILGFIWGVPVYWFLGTFDRRLLRQFIWSSRVLCGLPCVFFHILFFEIQPPPEIHLINKLFGGHLFPHFFSKTSTGNRNYDFKLNLYLQFGWHGFIYIYDF